MEKTGILATKIDIVLAIIRISFFFDDKLLVKKSVERAGTLVESGGDWVSVPCLACSLLRTQLTLHRTAGTDSSHIKVSISSPSAPTTSQLPSSSTP